MASPQIVSTNLFGIKRTFFMCFIHSKCIENDIHYWHISYDLYFWLFLLFTFIYGIKRVYFQNQNIQVCFSVTFCKPYSARHTQTLINIYFTCISQANVFRTTLIAYKWVSYFESENRATKRGIPAILYLQTSFKGTILIIFNLYENKTFTQDRA